MKLPDINFPENQNIFFVSIIQGFKNSYTANSATIICKAC